MKIAGIEYDDIANGDGIGVALFVQGCDHHCKGCHNPITWDFSCGKDFKKSDIEDIVNYFKQNPFATRLTITGGDPLNNSNIRDVAMLIFLFKQILPAVKIWLYSGYTWEEIFCSSLKNDDPHLIKNKQRQSLVILSDVFVDGKFDIEKRDITLQFRGSSNQRVIDVSKSLESSKVILWGE